MMKKLISILLLSFVFTLPSIAQTECSYYHRKACDNKDNEPMKYDSQSKSAILGKGQISEFHMVAYDGLDYRVSLCAEENLGQVQFKIYEKKRELIKPEEALDDDVYEEEQISNEEEDEYADETYDEYSDNTYSEDYSDSYSDAYSDDAYSDASSASTSNEPKFRLVKEELYDNADDAYASQIEFTADGTMSLILEVSVPGDESKGKLKIREMGCVGVLIEHAKSRQAGFH